MSHQIVYQDVPTNANLLTLIGKGNYNSIEGVKMSSVKKISEEVKITNESDRYPTCSHC